MKKVLFTAIFLLLFLSGCKTKSPEVIPITTGLKFNAQIFYLGNNYEYNVVIDSNSNCEITDNSTNIKYYFQGSKLTIEYNGISHETDSLSDKLPLDLIYSVFNSINHSTAKPITENNNCYIKSADEKYSYTCYFGMSGLPVKIEESNFPVTVDIKNCTIIKSS